VCRQKTCLLQSGREKKDNLVYKRTFSPTAQDFPCVTIAETAFEGQENNAKAE
jgi:hypothetical protein